MKSPKVHSVKKISKIIKGSGESRNSQQYLVDRSGMEVKGLKILPPKKKERNHIVIIYLLKKLPMKN